MTHGFVWDGGLCDLGVNVVACLFGDFVPLSFFLFERNKRHRGEAARKLSAVRPPSVNCCGFDNGGVRCLIRISCSSAGCHAYSRLYLFLNIFLCQNKRSATA